MKQHLLTNWWFEWTGEAVDEIENWYTLYVKGKALPMWSKLVGICLEILWCNRNQRRLKDNVVWSKEIFVKQFTWRLKNFLELVCEYQGWVKKWMAWSLDRRLFDLISFENKGWVIEEICGISRANRNEDERITEIENHLNQNW